MPRLFLFRYRLKTGRNSDDVIIASSGQSVLLHVKNHDRDRIQDIVDFLQRQKWTGLLFTKPPEGSDGISGWVDGTFSLQLIHSYNTARAADIILTFRWFSEKNLYGYIGTSYTLTGRATGPLAGNGGGHGNISPVCVRNTFFATGPRFKSGVTLQTPAGNVDVVVGSDIQAAAGGQRQVPCERQVRPEREIPRGSDTQVVERIACAVQGRDRQPVIT